MNQEGFLPCPPNVTYCVRVSAFPAGTAFGSLVADILASGPADKAFTLSSVLGATLAGSDVPARLGAMLGARAGDSHEQLAGEAGQVLRLLASISDMVSPGEGSADIW
jgi:hypothetical protein